MPDAPRPGGSFAALNRLPLAALFLLTFVIYTGLGLLLGDLQHRIDALYVVLRVAIGLVLSTVTTFGIARQRRRLGGADEVTRFARALRTGEVPPDTDRDAWLRQLDLQRGRVRRWYWLGVPLAGVLIAIGVVLAVDARRDPAPALVLAAIGVALLVGGSAAAVVARRRLDRLGHRLAR